jgi:hypothetical protein
MTFVRLIWPILMNILLAAHFLRFSGMIPAILILLINLTLLIRRPIIITLWQVLLGMASLLWIYVSFGFIQFRMATSVPWTRLAIIMGAIVLLNVGCIFWMNNKKLQKYFTQYV